MRLSRLIIFTSLLLLPNTGCNREDAEKLVRISGKVSNKLTCLVPEKNPFGGEWHPGLENPLVHRVRMRFQTDRFLAEIPIEITAQENQIHLKGTIADAVLKQRAIELAESTVGVDSVIDELEKPAEN